MTDLEKTLELFESFGLLPEQSTLNGNLLITLRTDGPKSKGYGGFVTDFEFNPDGSFKEVGIWE